MPKKKQKKRKVLAGAPYVEPDSRQLGDKFLHPVEANIKKREELLATCEKRKIWGQDELEDPDRSSGPRMNYTEILRRLTNLNPNIKVKDGIPGNLAVYVKKRHWEYDEEEHDPERDEWFWHHKYVTGMPKDFLPEYSHVDIDSSHLATREHRGWRSVLIAMVRAGAITYRQAIKEFGDPIHDRRSTRWFDQLQQHMNH